MQLSWHLSVTISTKVLIDFEEKSGTTSPAPRLLCEHGTLVYR
jgi:hypothetical protein